VPCGLGRVGTAAESLLLEARRANEGTQVCNIGCGRQHDWSAKVKELGDRGSRHVQPPTRNQRDAPEESWGAPQLSLPMARCVEGLAPQSRGPLAVPLQERPRADRGERCGSRDSSEWRTVSASRCEVPDWSASVG
jgi:hypothetical protein